MLKSGSGLTATLAGGEEAIVGFEHQGGEAGAVVGREGIVSDEAGCDCFDALLVAFVHRLEGSVFFLVVEDLVAEELVVAFPLGATVVDHGLDSIVVAVEIGIWAIPLEFHFLVHEADGLAGNLGGGGFPNLGAKGSDGCKGGSVLLAVKTGRGVTDGSAGELHPFDIVEPVPACVAKVFEIESGEFARLEGLEVPADDGDVSATSAVLAVAVIPSTALVLAVDEELAGGHDGILELEDVFTEGFDAKGVGFGESIGGNGMFVAPVVVFKVAGELAIVLHRLVDEVGDGGEDGFSELLGLGGFAMAEVGQESESGHANLILVGP